MERKRKGWISLALINRKLEKKYVRGLRVYLKVIARKSERGERELGLREKFAYNLFFGGEDYLSKKESQSPAGCRRARRWSREARRTKYNVIYAELYLNYLRHNKPQIP